jgi:hypothetical protein
MRAWKKALPYVACSVFFVPLQGFVFTASAQQSPETTPSAAGTANSLELARMSELPDSPGATRAAETEKANSSSQQSEAQSSQQPPQKPVGTAVAESPNNSGVAASQPAGVAIAPAKQRRVRTIVLRMGAIIGAGAAIGSVVALTAATSSKPPGAH